MFWSESAPSTMAYSNAFRGFARRQGSSLMPSGPATHGPGLTPVIVGLNLRKEYSPAISNRSWESSVDPEARIIENTKTPVSNYPLASLAWDWLGPTPFQATRSGPRRLTISNLHLPCFRFLLRTWSRPPRRRARDGRWGPSTRGDRAPVEKLLSP